MKKSIFILFFVASCFLLTTCGIFNDVLNNVSSNGSSDNIRVRIKPFNLSGNWLFCYINEEKYLKISSFWMDDFPLIFDVKYNADSTTIFSATISNVDSSKVYYYKQPFEFSTDNFESFFMNEMGYGTQAKNDTPKIILKKGTVNDLTFNYNNDHTSSIGLVGTITVVEGKKSFSLLY